MIEISYFRDSKETRNPRICTIEGALKSIRTGGINGRIKMVVEQIRSLPIEKRSVIKEKELNLITWQGIFDRRCDVGIRQLSSLMCIDIDHIPMDELNALRHRLSQEPWVLAFFLSPGGDGLKVIVKTDNYDIGSYKNCYKQVEKLFHDQYGVKTDPACEALSQGCFASYDPDLYMNLTAIDLHVEFDPAFEGKATCQSCHSTASFQLPELSATELCINQLRAMSSGMSDDEIIRILDYKFKQFPQNYQDGHRTKSIFAQATTLCKAGISFDQAIEYLGQNFMPTGYDARKLLYEAQKAYSKHQQFFGSERSKYRPYSEYKAQKRR